MGGASFAVPAGFHTELRGAEPDFWHSLLLGVAIGEIVLGVVSNILSSENP